MAPDTWEKLLYDTLKGLLAFCTPLAPVYLLSLLFKNVTKSFTSFIAEAIKSEFKTDVGKTNLLGILILFLVLVIPSNSGETSASTKGFILGLVLLGSLLISCLQNRQRRVAEDKDDKEISRS